MSSFQNLFTKKKRTQSLSKFGRMTDHKFMNLNKYNRIFNTMMKMNQKK